MQRVGHGTAGARRACPRPGAPACRIPLSSRPPGPALTQISSRPSPSAAGLAGMLDLVPVATVILDRPGLGVLAGNAEAAALLGCRPGRLAEVWGTALEGRAGR